ncbi:MAG: DUF2332 domain-containing protein [Lacisediminihabitans sp.]
MRDTAEWYRDFAEVEARDRSAIYTEWASGIAEDPALIALIDELPETTRQPSLVFASVRMLGAPELGFAEFRQWMFDNWRRVRPEAATRLNQTNEPGRCASLMPALATLPGPLALLEVGVSGGLCLYPDRYSYLYDDTVRIDPMDGPSAVLLRCLTNGQVPIPRALPEIVWRAGIDLAPLDVARSDDRRWLETLAWPEENDRRERIRAAIDSARADPPLLVQGQATDALAGLAAQAPAGATLVVITSGVLVYLPYLERQRFIAAVRELGAHWLSLEGVDVLPRVREALPPGEGRFVLALDEHPLAFTGPHGQSLNWFVPPL